MLLRRSSAMTTASSRKAPLHSSQKMRNSKIGPKIGIHPSVRQPPLDPSTGNRFGLVQNHTPGSGSDDWQNRYDYEILVAQRN